MPLTLLPLTASAGDPREAPGIERRLHPHLVEASSSLWNDWNRLQENDHPSYAAGDDPHTVWTESAPSSGAGSWIRFQVTRRRARPRCACTPAIGSRAGSPAPGSPEATSTRATPLGVPAFRGVAEQRARAEELPPCAL